MIRWKRYKKLLHDYEVAVNTLRGELDRVTEQREREKAKAERWKYEAEDNKATAEAWEDAWREVLDAIGRSGYTIAYRPTGYEHGDNGTTTVTKQEMWIVEEGKGDGVN